MSHKHDPYFNAKLNGKEKFGFRKLSIGLAAVALGTSFFVNSGQLVHAADDTATETVVQQSSSVNDNEAATSSSPAVAENTSSETATAETANAEDTSSETAPAENTSSETAPAEETVPAADEQKQTAVTSSQTTSAENEDKAAAEPAKESETAAKTSIPENEAGTSQNKTEAQEAKQSSVSYDITVYDSAENAKSANPAGKIESSPDQPANLTPGNQNIYLRFNISGIKESDSPLTISFDNAGGLRNSSKDFAISYNAGTTTLLEQQKAVWKLINNGDGTLTLSRVENTNATSADFYIPVQANRAINPSLSDEGKDSSLTPVITTSDGSVVSPATSGPILYAKITPAKDFVQRAEILYGFSMEEKSLTAEMGYNPGASAGDSTDISLEHELELLKANSDDDVKQFIDSAVANNTVYQWGYYFNYPKTSLENAAFRSYFDKMQIPLYSTLKVFAVPDDLVSYTNSAGQTVRIGEDQKLSELPEEIQQHYIDGKNITGDTTVYSIITSTPTVTGLQDYLRGLIKKQTRTASNGYDSSIPTEENGFTSDQADLTQYAGKAYFFQLDTLPSAGSGTSMHFEDGRAGTYNVPLNRNGDAGGFGGGSTITTRERKTITEQIKYVDEDKIGTDATAEDIFDAAFGKNGDQYSISSDYKSGAVTLTREIITEEATGIQTYGDWTISSGFNAVNNPDLASYKIDASKIYEQFMGEASALASTSTEAVGSVQAEAILKEADGIADGAILQVVVPYKQTISVSQESKTLTEEIKYVDEDTIEADSTAEEIFNAAFGNNGNQYSISDDYKASAITLTRTVYTNDVTGEKTYSDWTISSGFNAVSNPTIDNYKIDASKIYEQFMGAASALATTSAEAVGSVQADALLKEADTITDGAVLQVVVPYKQTISVSQETKALSEQIKYVDEDKIGADSTAEEIFNAAFGEGGDQYSISDDYKASKVTLTRDVYTNDVTGEKTYGDWTISSGFNAVSNPTIDNYKIDGSKIYEQFMGEASALATTSADSVGNVQADAILKEADGIADGAILQVVVPYKQNISVSQETKALSEQIKYVDEDKIGSNSSAEEIFNAAFGNNGDQYSISNDYKSSKVTLTRDVYTNDVTGEKTYGDWTVSGGFNAVSNPDLASYKIDASKIYEQFMEAASALASTSAENIGSVQAEAILKEAEGITDGAVLQVVVPYKQNISVSQETKTLSEQIKYVDEDKIGSDSSAVEIFNAAFGEGGDQYSISGDYKSNAVILTRDVYTNDVTGEKTYGDWTISSGFSAVNNPAIDNYKIDASKIYEQFMGEASALATTSAEAVGSVQAEAFLKEAEGITDGAVLQVVVPYKQTISVSQETKTLAEEIKYVDEDKIGSDSSAVEIFNAAFGNNGDQYSISGDYKSGSITLTRDVYTNDVTGEQTYGDWTISSGFNVVNNPAIDNYKIDASKIYEKFMDEASALASTSANSVGSVQAEALLKEADTITDGAVLQIVVPYTVVPTKPDKPTTPTTPDVPTTPTTPDVPTTPTTPDVPTTPTTPDVPTTPTTPDVPTTPTTPDVPTTPTTPDVPTTPTTPDVPTTPTTPDVPTTPTTPDVPTTPTTPDVPTTPTTPDEPTTPTVPSKPTTPNEPTTPTVPSKPTTPNEPTTPTVPSKPAKPNVPTTRQLSHGGTPSKHKHVTTSKSNETTLPQTGEKKSNYNLAAMILTLLSSLLFAFTGKKHKND